MKDKIVNEQQEAKAFHAAQIFTNIVFGISKDLHETSRNKNDKEKAYAFNIALNHSIAEAQMLLENKYVLANSPFKDFEVLSLSLHAILFAFNQASSFSANEMNGYLTAANTLNDDLTKKRLHEGNSASFTPMFFIKKDEDGSTVMGITIHSEANKQ